MCGRYLIEADDMELSDIVAAAQNSLNARTSRQLFTGGEIFPGSMAPVLTADDGARFMHWGFPGLISEQRPHINARSETAAALRTFSGAMASRRCIVPATSYFEWKALGKGRKDKYEFTLPDRAPMYMAGIYSGDGRFAILTRAAAPVLLEIHGRMPVIIPKRLTSVWLNETPEPMREAVTELTFERAM